MKLFLVAYANAAVVLPALWIGARLWMLRHFRAQERCTAQIIPFPTRQRLKRKC